MKILAIGTYCPLYSAVKVRVIEGFWAKVPMIIPIIKTVSKMLVFITCYRFALRFKNKEKREMECNKIKKAGGAGLCY